MKKIITTILNSKYRFWIALVSIPIFTFLLGFFVTFLFIWSTRDTVRSPIIETPQVEEVVIQEPEVFLFNISFSPSEFHTLQLSSLSTMEQANNAIEIYRERGVASFWYESEASFRVIQTLSTNASILNSYRNDWVQKFTEFEDAYVNTVELTFKDFEVYFETEATKNEVAAALESFFFDMGNVLLNMHTLQVVHVNSIETELSKLTFAHNELLSYKDNYDIKLTGFIGECLSAYDELIENEGTLEAFLAVYVGQIMKLTTFTTNVQ